MLKKIKLLNSKFLLTASFCLLISVAFAQKEKPKNLATYDKKYLHFGFSLGLTSGNTIIRYTENAFKDSLLKLEPVSQSGFGLGIVTDFQFAPNFDVRFIPSLSFINRKIEYTFSSNRKQQYPTNSDTLLTQTIESTQLDFPLSLKFKSERVNNYRWYLLTGMKYSMDLNSNKDQISSGPNTPLKIQKFDYAYELGIGLDFYLNYFKFSPELKFSLGGNKNMLVKDNTAYSNPIQSLKTKTFYISFLFE